MQTRVARYIAVASLAALSFTVAGMAIAAQSTQPTTRPARLVQPWNKVTDLTDAQRAELIAIHAETTAKINALRREEVERCNAVLSAEQRAVLSETLTKEAAERKARAAERRNAADSSTSQDDRPAN